MGYPNVMSEIDTIAAAINGASLARYGDGELRIALGGDCVSQVKDPGLSRELREVLKIKEGDNCLPCIPRVDPDGPNFKAWQKYQVPAYADLYTKRTYGSSFVTRPDSVPWIDHPDYWAEVHNIWKDRLVILVHGNNNNLKSAELHGAAFVTEISAPRRDAYAAIDQLEAEIMRQRSLMMGSPLCVMNLGPTATVLAARLSRRGLQSIDAGHIGMFMRSAGAYSFSLDDLASPAYRVLLEDFHAKNKWGGGGRAFVGPVLEYLDALKGNTILDYGCGRGGLAGAMSKEEMAKREPRVRILQFDPGVVDRRGWPKPCHLLVCTDVLEHVEPEKLTNVLTHQRALAQRGAFFVISCRPAKAVLGDGRNAHINLREPGEWCLLLTNAGFNVTHHEINGGAGRELVVWAK